MPVDETTINFTREIVLAYGVSGLVIVIAAIAALLFVNAWTKTNKTANEIKLLQTKSETKSDEVYREIIAKQDEFQREFMKDSRSFERSIILQVNELTRELAESKSTQVITANELQTIKSQLSRAQNRLVYEIKRREKVESIVMQLLKRLKALHRRIEQNSETISTKDLIAEFKEIQASLEELGLKDAAG